MLHERTERSGNFLTVKFGAICLESKEEKPGYEMVEGDVAGRSYRKYIRKFAGVTGLLVGLKWYMREFDGTHFRGLQLTLKDGNEIYFLELPFEKRPFDSFCLSAENIDLTQPVRFEAYYDTKRAKPNKPVPTGFVIKQGGQMVAWNYTKDNPGDCPQPVFNELTGKWNFDARRAWLLDRVLKVVKPQIEELYGIEEWIVTDEASNEQIIDKNDPLYSGPDVTQEPPPETGAPDYYATDADDDGDIPF